MSGVGAGWRDNPLEWISHEARLGRRAAEGLVGGPARAKVVLLLACVLGLDSADKGATGALAADLEAAFHIGNVELGLLIAVSSLVGALATLPMGIVADRSRRVRALAVVVLIWSVAEAASGLAISYLMLLLIRVALGLVTAAAGPIIASLVGDLFPARERGRIYGFILTGELVGAGVGLVVAGDLATVLSWRGGYAVLALPSLALAWFLWRSLPEPARGGQSTLEEGATAIPSAEEVAAHPERHPVPEEGEDLADQEEGTVVAAVREQGIDPEDEVVLEGDPAELGILDAVRWVLRVRTNVALILASALGYFFLGGVRSFAVIFVRGWYGVGQAAASSLVLVVGAGAVAGVVLVGRLTDGWVRRGRFDARILSGAGGYILAAAVFIPALVTRSLGVAIPLIVVAAFWLAGANPPVDAARLDVIPSSMWGRAEAIRTFLRQILEAFAPLVFGLLATALGGGAAGAGFGAGVNSSHAHVSPGEALGLRYSFLAMLAPLAGAGVLLLVSRHRYGVDVASAAETDERTRRARRRSRRPPGPPRSHPVVEGQTTAGRAGSVSRPDGTRG